MKGLCLGFAAGFFIALMLIAPAVRGQSFESNTTIYYTNRTNGSVDTHFVGNASTISGANLLVNFSREGPFERRGLLYRDTAGWAAGTLVNATGINVLSASPQTYGGTSANTTDENWYNTTTGCPVGIPNCVQGFDHNKTVEIISAPRSNDQLRANSSFGNKLGSWNISFDFIVRGCSGFGAAWFFMGEPGGTPNTNQGPFMHWFCNDLRIYYYTRLYTPVVVQTPHLQCGADICSPPTIIGRPYRAEFHNITANNTMEINIYDLTTNTLFDSVVFSHPPAVSCPTTCFMNFSAGNAADGVGGDVSAVTWNLRDSNNSTGGFTQMLGSWSSEVRDTATPGQRYSTLRFNSTTTGGLINYTARASDHPFSADNTTLQFIQITGFTNTTPACPCSTGTNMSNLTGRYIQLRVNFTGETAFTQQVSNLQVILTASDVGTFQLNGNNNTFIEPTQITLVPAQFLSGLNTFRWFGNNTSFYDATLTYTAGAGIVIDTNTRTCHAYQNVTAFANVTNIVLAFARPSGTFVFNTSAFLNGTLETSNRTNATVFDYGVSNNSTTVLVNRSSLSNGSTWNVLVDFVCLNATVNDEANGSALSSFTIQQINVLGGQTKSTTRGFLEFNGTELVGSGGAVDLRVSSSGYEARDFAVTLPGATANRTFTLLQSADGVFVVFQIVDPNNVPIFGATVTARLFTTNATVCTGTTDSAGTVRCFLNPSTTYVVTVSAGGFQPAVFTIQPTQTLFVIRMGFIQDFVQPGLTAFRADFLPVVDSLTRAANQRILLNVTSTICGLVNITLSSTYGSNVTTVQNNTSAPGSTACGMRLAITWDLSAAHVDRQRVTAGAIVHFRDLDGTIQRWQHNRSFQIYAVNATNVSAFKAIAGGSPGLVNILTPFGANLVALMVSFFVTLFTAIRAPVGSVGAGALFIGCCGVFLVAGLLDAATLTVAAMAVVGLVLMRRGGF